ncbi:rab-like protein 3 isoform X2 [Dysidea avara]
MTDYNKKVKILVLGDSGVGKTSLVHILCHDDVLSNPAYTIGCSVEVRLHDYNKIPSAPSYYIEFWDIGGTLGHEKGRSIFYNSVNGIIAVHDLTNRKSHTNLRKWISEALCQSSSNSELSSHSADEIDFDMEKFVGENIPILVVGTKQDQIGTVGGDIEKGSSVAHEAGAEILNVDCTQCHHFAPGSPHMIKLNNFFDKIIENKFYPKTSHQAHL